MSDKHREGKVQQHFCPSCGANLEGRRRVNFCPKCGTEQNFTQIERKTEAPPEPQARRRDRGSLADNFLANPPGYYDPYHQPRSTYWRSPQSSPYSVEDRIKNAIYWRKKLASWRRFAAVVAGIILSIFLFGGPMYNTFTGAELLAVLGVFGFLVLVYVAFALSVVIWLVDKHLGRLRAMRRR
jgi:predicted RNA-binding Zn-ribbon protein involved in translation (DUF1610 family)